MAKTSTAISPAELTVLKVLWNLSPLTVREVCDTLASQRQDWAYTTVQTLLNRLVTKGAVKRNPEGLAHRYAPAVSRSRLLASRLKDLAEQVCDGAASPLLSALVDTHEFTPEELAGFRDLLDQQQQHHANKKPRKRTR
ncbi:MAG: BlaI/MecI/CopY family transcriptional regulator [Candidatus Hydrogenedentes bacterium]|nr:BlaI/MecI/CopY family transcriptional regulator [Candidatus Hydrogenedentota bacterium]